NQPRNTVLNYIAATRHIGSDHGQCHAGRFKEHPRHPFAEGGWKNHTVRTSVMLAHIVRSTKIANNPLGNPLFHRLARDSRRILDAKKTDDMKFGIRKLTFHEARRFHKLPNALVPEQTRNQEENAAALSLRSGDRREAFNIHA